MKKNLVKTALFTTTFIGSTLVCNNIYAQNLPPEVSVDIEFTDPNKSEGSEVRIIVNATDPDGEIASVSANIHNKLTVSGFGIAPISSDPWVFPKVIGDNIAEDIIPGEHFVTVSAEDDSGARVYDESIHFTIPPLSPGEPYFTEAEDSFLSSSNTTTYQDPNASGGSAVTLHNNGFIQPSRLQRNGNVVAISYSSMDDGTITFFGARIGKIKIPLTATGATNQYNTVYVPADIRTAVIYQLLSEEGDIEANIDSIAYDWIADDFGAPEYEFGITHDNVLYHAVDSGFVPSKILMGYQGQAEDVTDVEPVLAFRQNGDAYYRYEYQLPDTQFWYIPSVEVTLTSEQYEGGECSVSFNMIRGGGFTDSPCISDVDITPAPDLYAIIHKPTSLRLFSCATENGTPVIASSAAMGTDCDKWEMIENGNFFHLKNKAGKFIRPASSVSGATIQVQPSTWTGNWTQWKYEDRGDGYGHLVNRATGKYIYVPSDGLDKNIELQPSSWRGDYTRFELLLIN